jgi:hypothetical protein
MLVWNIRVGGATEGLPPRKGPGPGGGQTPRGLFRFS